MSENDEMNQRPQKRTGVWSSDTSKQKTSDNVLKRLLKSDVKRIVSNEDDDDIPNEKDTKPPISDITKKNVEVELHRLPALKTWMNEVNMSLLLGQFNNPEEIKENDVLWKEDLLFAGVMNGLSMEKHDRKD